jgi:hypothetical protein
MNVTITKKNLVIRDCAHCGGPTLQVGPTGNTCLQCIADTELSGCCTLKAYNRWKDANGIALTEAQGKPL